ncbi:MAG: pyridoxal-phosphate dependent enzyme [Thermaceae bacterium]|nr:pyridoxal-phosphate dependent enzyme [Thermaceae bacterium]
MKHRLSLEHIEEASRIVDPVFLNTPQYNCESLSQVLGLELVVKVETLNPIRSFKGRGADYFISKVMERGDKRQIVCASAGNFGQAMAYACRKHQIPLIVYASTKANPLKIERMCKLGAEVRLHGEDFDAAKLEAKRFCSETGAWMVEDSKEVEISEGAGTLGLELLEYPQPLDAALIALGNGAMIAGMGRWIKAHRPQTQVVGVCAAGAPAMERSWRSGTFVQTNSISTIADGIGVRVPVPEALEDLKGIVDEVLLVEDDLTIEAMRLAHQHLGLVLEPSGAVGIAALLKSSPFQGKRVATVLCGGNLTPEQMECWL